CPESVRFAGRWRPGRDRAGGPRRGQGRKGHPDRETSVVTVGLAQTAASGRPESDVAIRFFDMMLRGDRGGACIAALTALLAAGCATPPPYNKPQLEMPPR